MGCFQSKETENDNVVTENMLYDNQSDVSESISWKDTKPFIVPISRGRVIKVYDGDTITIANTLPIHNCNDIFRFSVRLNGIDCPEIRGKSDEEKQAAQLSKTVLYDLVMNKVVELKNVSTEKYGRLLADVYIGEIHVNSWMIDNNYAIPYDGKTKTKFEDIEL